jgi:hypothetical protein
MTATFMPTPAHHRGRDEANGVSVWLTTQAYNRIPLMLRKLANALTTFKLKNVREIGSIFLSTWSALPKTNSSIS